MNQYFSATRIAGELRRAADLVVQLTHPLSLPRFADNAGAAKWPRSGSKPRRDRFVDTREHPPILAWLHATPKQKASRPYEATLAKHLTQDEAQADGHASLRARRYAGTGAGARSRSACAAHGVPCYDTFGRYSLERAAGPDGLAL